MGKVRVSKERVKTGRSRPAPPLAVELLGHLWGARATSQMWNAYSKSTWSSRSRVLRELLGNHPAKNASSAVALAKQTARLVNKRLNMNITKLTVAKDIPHIKWAWSVLNLVMPQNLALGLSTIQRGCRTAPRTTRKALPMTRTVLMAIARKLVKTQLPLMLVLILAFETASRIDDIFKLRHRMAFLPGKEGAMVVLWGATKANPTAEARSDHQQIIDNPGILRCLLERPHLLEHTNKRQVRRLLKTIQVPTKYKEYWVRMNPTVELRDHFTLHSLKRGRGHELWKAAAKGTLQLPEVLHRMKHKSEEAALAYAPDPVLAAEAVRRYNQGKQKQLPKRKPAVARH